MKEVWQIEPLQLRMLLMLKRFSSPCGTAVADLLSCRPEIVGTFCPGGTCSLLGTKEEEEKTTTSAKKCTICIRSKFCALLSFSGTVSAKFSSYRGDGLRRLWRVPSGINFPREQFITRCELGGGRVEGSISMRTICQSRCVVRGLRNGPPAKPEWLLSSQFQSNLALIYCEALDSIASSGGKTVPNRATSARRWVHLGKRAISRLTQESGARESTSIEKLR